MVGVQQGLIFSVVENISPDGTARIGSFLVIIDDGSGYPSTDLLSRVATAVDLVRPVGTSFTVVPPLVLKVDVSLTATVGHTNIQDNLTPAVEQQITTYLNSLPIEEVASVTRVALSAYAANPGIQNVTSVLLNGQSADATPNWSRCKGRSNNRRRQCSVMSPTVASECVQSLHFAGFLIKAPILIPF